MEETDKKIDQAPKKQKFSTIEDFHSPLIPKSFQLGGMTIDVQFQEKLAEQVGMIGIADYLSQQIRIDPTMAVKPMIEQTYLHELTHWILFTMNEPELCQNEKFVDIFAQFLYQALKTAVPHSSPSNEEEEIPFEEDGSIAGNIPFTAEDGDDSDLDEIIFSNEAECIPSGCGEDRYDHQNSYEYQAAVDEAAIEEEHRQACREAIIEDTEEYNFGVALSNEGGWFYDDD